MIRLGWLLVGWLCVGIGGVGVVVPGLPSTGFFIMAAGCFSKSSPRFERWVLGLPGIGPLVVDYRAGLGMPKRAKIQANLMMWFAIAVSAGLVIDILPVRLLIVVLGAIGSYVIVFRVPTKAAVAWTSA
jgi:uncharacterized membrane protein YbaN (DUF454 family)